MIQLFKGIKDEMRRLSTLQVLLILLVGMMSIYGSFTFPSYLRERKQLTDIKGQLLMEKQDLEAYQADQVQWQEQKDNLEERIKGFEQLFPYYEGDYVGLEQLKNKIEPYPISNLQVSFNKTDQMIPFYYSTYNLTYTTSSATAKQMIYDVIRSWGGTRISKLEWRTGENGQVDIQMMLEVVTRCKEEV